MNADQITGEKIHILMRRRGMSQGDLAPHLGIDQSSMSKKLYGKRTWTLDELLTVARVFDVEITELLPGDDYTPVLEGRGRVGARSKGLEPPTFWMVASQRATNSGGFWTAGRKSALLDIECQLAFDTRSASIAGL